MNRPLTSVRNRLARIGIYSTPGACGGPSCKLKTWGLALTKRIGMRRAKVAVARKLAVVMHRVWKDDCDFNLGDAPAAVA
jgi:hypothetical protein